jgi:hypothetical protein
MYILKINNKIVRQTKSLKSIVWELEKIQDPYTITGFAMNDYGDIISYSGDSLESLAIDKKRARKELQELFNKNYYRDNKGNVYKRI